MRRRSKFSDNYRASYEGTSSRARRSPKPRPNFTPQERIPRSRLSRRQRRANWLLRVVEPDRLVGGFSGEDATHRPRLSPGDDLSDLSVRLQGEYQSRFDVGARHFVALVVVLVVAAAGKQQHRNDE